MNIVYEKKQNVAWLQVNRPEALNALNIDIALKLGEYLCEIEKDEDIKVVVIGGRGNFAAGADIKGMVECTPCQAKSISFNPIFLKLESMSIPTIAAIDGYALGGGLELALACDLRIACENAKMGFPEINLGIIPGAGGNVRAPRLLGMAKAKELIFTGKQIDANEAEKIGLVNHVCKESEFIPYIEKLANTIAQKAPIAEKLAKKVINESLEFNTVSTAIDYEAKNWATLFETEDQKEGMRAFIEKRKPEYKGR